MTWRPSHYPVFENHAQMHIPDHTDKEKTGLHCARNLVDHNLKVLHWTVHNMNARGRINVEEEAPPVLCAREVRGLQTPYRILCRATDEPLPLSRQSAEYIEGCSCH
jgi:hypothetical protein